ncbi:hypothetical protein RN001_011252 [Aquatica leii]|uniref:Palmitoyl-protein thioesterase 1 n=1 Tax=Aquatica leii TaxID=1421715 RepID=A0AAN7S8W1_9COLE|nr:hypothetical protein RN001_011252 [Aquatica leii]
MYVKLLEIGNGVFEDFVNSVVMHPNKQIEIACASLQADPILRNGYIGVGFSQGGLLLRGLAQRCSYPRMTKMITMGTMHQGVYGLPHCSLEYLVCRLIRRIYNRIMYTEFFQNHFVPATYWHNPLDTAQYKEKNTYLTDINNENFINQTYIRNLNSLDKFVMVKYINEHFVVPPASEWFGYYKEHKINETETLEQAEMFLNDRLGLRRMYNAGKLDFLTVPWDHVEFHWDWFKDNIVDKYLL